MASRLSDQEMAELCALADGTLPAERRAAVEAWVAASPDRQQLLDRQRRAFAATRAAASEPAPASLQATVGARVGELGARRGRARRLVPRLALSGAAAAVAAVALVVALSGEPAGPTVADAARLAARAPSGPAPARLDGSRTELAAAVEGVQFPDLRRSYGWRAAGVRQGRVDGRDATVVYYKKGDRRIAYVIVAGSGLPRPSGGQETVRRGVEFQALNVDGRRTVTWQRRGHTCVLTGAAPPSELLTLAAWRGGGTLSY